jgi:1,4-dihydroxy-2-naphthoate octaprenyltransferase
MKVKFKTVFFASRPKFLTASISPVLVGSALGFAVTGGFDWILFLLAMFAITALHSGANLANDYFDHISRNDWLNENPTPYSGGSRFIQKGLTAPGTILAAAVSCLALGSAVGLIIVWLTGSGFILVLGLAGALGGFFYTAPPLRLGYRGAGEVFIAFLFGLLPVYGAYYLQTGVIDYTPLLPGGIIGILVFLIILVNEFPDLSVDAAVNKRTLVVLFGVPAAVWIYRIALGVSFVLAAAAAVLYRSVLAAAILYFLTSVVAVGAMKLVNKKDISVPGAGQVAACRTTILMHTAGTAALAAGLTAYGLFR